MVEGGRYAYTAVPALYYVHYEASLPNWDLTCVYGNRIHFAYIHTFVLCTYIKYTCAPRTVLVNYGFW